MTKEEFVQRYNPKGSVAVAAYSAIAAAARHNELYAESISDSEKQTIRAKWKKKLEEISERYIDPVDLQSFLEDIVTLQKTMSTEFPRALKEFKISHAQKSLSVFLKHAWCLDLIPEPPACPIDRLVFKLAGVTNVNWTQVTSIGEYIQHVTVLQSTAERAGMTLAQWELQEFN